MRIVHFIPKLVQCTKLREDLNVWKSEYKRYNIRLLSYSPKAIKSRALFVDLVSLIIRGL